MRYELLLHALRCFVRGGIRFATTIQLLNFFKLVNYKHSDHTSWQPERMTWTKSECDKMMSFLVAAAAATPPRISSDWCRRTEIHTHATVLVVCSVRVKSIWWWPFDFQVIPFGRHHALDVWTFVTVSFVRQPRSHDPTISPTRFDFAIVIWSRYAEWVEFFEEKTDSECVLCIDSNSIFPIFLPQFYDQMKRKRLQNTAISMCFFFWKLC